MRKHGLPSARRRLGVGLVAAGVAAVAVLLGGALRDSSAPAAAPTSGREVAPQLAAGFAAGDTAALIESLEERARAEPGDAETLRLLGLAYQQRYRETVDAGLLTRAGAALARSQALEPRDADTVAALASLALSRHEFRRALALGRRAGRLRPRSAAAYGAIGDALLELGRYDQAFRTFDTMARRKPGLAAYARVAYGRELLGRPHAAIDAMRLALAAASGQREPTAWVLVELAKLHFSLGETRDAAGYAHAALTAYPGYVYALDLLARVEGARGHTAVALRYARHATDEVPLPQFVTTLGDLYRASGRPAEAREQYAVIGAIERLLRANGVRTELETALFDIDHGVRLREALSRARRAHAERPSILADDVLAWALARNGRCGEALRYSKRALRLGTQDASSFFHRGMIERCLARGDEARTWFRRALERNPHFSLVWADVARRLAEPRGRPRYG